MDKPNVEIQTVAWLGTVAGEAWPIHGDMPDPRPDNFILVDRTGGAREAMVLDTAEILIEVYCKDSRELCSSQANYIADRVPELVTVENITRAVVNSVVKLDDTVGQYYRYQIYCDIYSRR